MSICQCFKVNGNRCSYKAKPNSLYCGVHKACIRLTESTVSKDHRLQDHKFQDHRLQDQEQGHGHGYLNLDQVKDLSKMELYFAAMGHGATKNIPGYILKNMSVDNLRDVLTGHSPVGSR